MKTQGILPWEFVEFGLVTRVCRVLFALEMSMKVTEGVLGRQSSWLEVKVKDMLK